MQIVVLASQKGGAGKTTLTGHLAIAAEQRGVQPVIMIDTDPQGSLSTWSNRRQAETLLLSPLPLKELHRGGISLVLFAPRRRSPAPSGRSCVWRISW